MCFLNVYLGLVCVCVCVFENRERKGRDRGVRVRDTVRDWIFLGHTLGEILFVLSF